MFATEELRGFPVCDFDRKTVGITGGIGSGKSVVSRILRCNGYSVYDCDREAKILMNQDAEIVRSLREIAGDEVYSNDGFLNRKYLAERLFADVELRLKVNALVHEAVRNDLKRCKEHLNGIFFIESAIMSTAGIDDLCDEIWLVEADENTRITRVKSRDNLSIDEIKKRIESQKNEFDRLPETKTVRILNDGDSGLIIEILNNLHRLNSN